MEKIAAFIRSQSTSRRVLVALAVAVVLALVSRYIAVPIYRDVAGFTPFDVQESLSRFMIAFELGAIGKDAATGAYVLFALVDAPAVLATAWFFAVFWTWLFIKNRTRLFSFLMRGGIIMLPFYVVVLDFAAKVAFFRLLRGLAGDSYGATVDFAVMAHRLKFAFIDLRDYLSVALLVASVFAVFLRRRRR
jgi:hypothetical protein